MTVPSVDSTLASPKSSTERDEVRVATMLKRPGGFKDPFKVPDGASVGAISAERIGSGLEPHVSSWCGLDPR